MTFTPLLSKNSMKIARKLNRSKSLKKKKQFGKSQEELDLIRKNEIRKKAVPKINKKSKYLDKNSNLNELERFERLYRYSQIYSKKAQIQKRKKIEEELEKEIYLNSKKHHKKTRNSGIYNTIDISERNLVWQNRKNQRMEKIRKEKELEEKKNCTFKPKILGKDYIKKKDKGMAYTSEFVKEGLINHFNRIKMAKKKKSYNDLSRSKSRKSLSKNKKFKINKVKKLKEEREEESYNNYIKYNEQNEFDNEQNGFDLKEKYSSIFDSKSDILSITEREQSFGNILENLKRINKIM